MRKFAVWWLRNKPFAPPADALRILKAGQIHGVTLYRHGQFQAQLFILKPKTWAPNHAHPNIDSIEVPVAGRSEFVCDRNMMLAGMFLVAPSEWHTAAATDAGAAFISIQKWINGVLPTSVELDWAGDVMDADHEKELTNVAGR